MKRAFVVSLILHLGVLSGLLWWWSGRDEPRFFSVRVATVQVSYPPSRPAPALPQKPQAAVPVPAPVPALPASPPNPAFSAEPRSESSQPAPGPDTAMTPLLTAEAELVPAALAAEVKPVYPREARRRNWEGVVEVQVEVGDDGRWRGGRVTGSSGHVLLDEAALQALRSAVFRPASRDGVPQTGTLTARVRFVLKGAD